MRANALSGKYEAKGTVGQGEGGRYSAVDSDPESFVPDENGNIDYGEISEDIAQEIGRQQGKIRLQLGTPDGFGKLHIKRGHSKELKQQGFDDIESFVSQIVSGFTEIRKGTGGTLILVKRNGGNKIAYVQLKPLTGEKEFYTVNSATFARPEYVADKELLWERAQSNHSTKGTPNAITGQSNSGKNITDNSDSRKNNSRYRKAEPSYKDHIGPKAVEKKDSYLTWFEKFITNVFDSQYALKKLEQGLDIVGSMSG